jgi:hypothetical protein
MRLDARHCPTLASDLGVLDPGTSFIDVVTELSMAMLFQGPSNMNRIVTNLVQLVYSPSPEMNLSTPVHRSCVPLKAMRGGISEREDPLCICLVCLHDPPGENILPTIAITSHQSHSLGVQSQYLGTFCWNGTERE